MTIGKLHKILSKLVEQGQARKKICIQTTTFHSPMAEDGAVILEVFGAELESFPMLNEHGSTMLESGCESCHTAVVLKGDHEPQEE